MNHQDTSSAQAQLILPTKNLNQDMAFLQKLGFRLHQIFPAEDPAVAIMEGHHMYLRLDKNAKTSPANIHLLIDAPEEIGIHSKELEAPNGTVFKILPKTTPLEIPATQHAFEVRKLQHKDPWIIGRAGMHYRDLIPDRLGGSIIASHISIPEGGPVPDVVHYHTIGFQLIFCYKGWVKLVYEDQGPPFILQAGDCVTQPPEIRHRVLEASDKLEVIEIGVPAEHITTIDHDMELPTQNYNPERTYKGQHFCRHIAKDAIWETWRIPGFESRNTTVDKATRGMASAHVVRGKKVEADSTKSKHNADILFAFVMGGKANLAVEKHQSHQLMAGDAFVIPPGLEYQFKNYSGDFEFLEVTLPGTFKTFLNA